MNTPDFAKHSLCCSYQLCPLDTEQPQMTQPEQAVCLQKMRRWAGDGGLEAPEAAKASARHPGIVIHTPTYASTYDRFTQ